MEPQDGAVPSVHRSNDSWFDRFIDELEAGRIAGREDIARRFGRIGGTELAVLETLWGAWQRGESGAEDSRGAGGGERFVRRREIGRGGMGVVHEAWDTLLDRAVAMKSLAPAGLRMTRSAVARFLNEAKLTARLDHPGIVPVFDLAKDVQGRLFYTMRLVHGRTLREIFPLARARRDGWTLGRAVGLLVQVCEIAGFAHSRGIIHRDLKPTNVMVGDFGEVYVLDWGLARDLELPLAERGEAGRTGAPQASADPSSDAPSPSEPTTAGVSIGITVDGTVLGTPAFMAPEQAAGNSATVGVEADVYAVGAILYTLLAGEEPYADGLRERPRAEQLARVLAGAPRELAALAPSAPAELVSICARAMARSPADRYASCLDLAADLRAWLEGRVVRAHEAGLRAEARKWVRRNPALAIALGLAAVLALAGAAAFAVLESRWVRDLAARQELARRHLYAAHLRLAQDGIEAASCGPVRELLKRQLPAPGDEDLRCFGWRHLSRRLHPHLRAFAGLEGGALALQFIEPGSTIVAGVARKGPLIAWDAQSGERLASRRFALPIDSAAIAREGTALLLLAEEKAGQKCMRLEVLRLESDAGGAAWKERSAWPLDVPAAAVAITPDARCALAACTDQRIRIWDLAAPERAPRASAALGGVDDQLVVSGDGRLLASKSNREVLRVLSLPALEVVAAREIALDLPWVAFSKQSEALAVPLRGGGVAVLGLRERGLPVLQELRSPLATSEMAFVEDDGRLLIGAGSVLESWDLASGARLRRWIGHANRLFRLGASADGRFVVSSDDFGEVFFWDLARPEEPQRRHAATDHYRALWLDSRGEELLAIREPAVLERFSLGAVHAGTGEAALEGEIALAADPDLPFDVAPDLSLAAVGGPDGSVRLLRLGWAESPPSTREEALLESGARERISALAFAQRLPRLVAVGEKGQITEWERDRDGAWRPRAGMALAGSGAAVDQVAVASASRVVALVRGRDPGVILADLAAQRALAICQGHSEWVLGVSFSADGSWLATASRDRSAALWEVPRQALGAAGGGIGAVAPARVFRGHSNAISAAVFLPDGQILATASDDATVRLWDLVTGEERLTLRGHLHYANALAATRDGWLLISAGGKRSPPQAEIVFWPAR